MGTAAANAAAAAMLARIVIEGCQAEQGSGLPPSNRAQFGELGTEAGGGDRATAGHRLNDLSAPGKVGVGGDAMQHALVAGRDVVL